MSVDDVEGRAETRLRVNEFAQLSRALADAPNESARLQIAVDSAVLLVNSCDHAGITIRNNDGLDTRVRSSDVVRRADQLQSELQQGPCLVVMRDQETLVSPDLAREERWPDWAVQVHDELGLGSMMSVLIYAERDSFGALSLYAKQGSSFDIDDVAVGQALAAQIGMVMAAERQIDQLGIALHSRLTIGQAQGVLMERLGMTSHQAFDYLRRVSSNCNVKLVDVANQIATTRELPKM